MKRLGRDRQRARLPAGRRAVGWLSWFALLTSPVAAQQEKEVVASPRFEVLATPLSERVKVPGGRVIVGSSQPELLQALADCVKEPYGHRCSPTLFVDELPRRELSVEDFWLDRYEVTVAQYERCVQRGLCASRPPGPSARLELPQHPVTRVSWFEAQRYCEVERARLPTELEFERAARGGRGRRFPWGQLFNRRIVNAGRFGWDETDDTDGFALSAPVGSFPSGATPEGIHDLAGNVAEWVSERYSNVEDVAGASRTAKAVRGGSYRTGRAWMRGAARQFAEGGERSESVGFRCAHTIADDGPRTEGTGG